MNEPTKTPKQPDILNLLQDALLDAGTLRAQLVTCRAEIETLAPGEPSPATCRGRNPQAGGKSGHERKCFTLMNTYRIISSCGVHLGDYEGETEEDALDAMSQDAGYDSHAEVVAQFGCFDGTIELIRGEISSAITKATK